MSVPSLLEMSLLLKGIFQSPIQLLNWFFLRLVHCLFLLAKQFPRQRGGRRVADQDPDFFLSELDLNPEVLEVRIRIRFFFTVESGFS